MEAPLVSLDEEFEDLRPCYPEVREEKPRSVFGSPPAHLEDPSLSELENFSSEIISFKSMEDLVNEFDEKLNVCFRNYNAKTENLAPVKNQLQIQEEEETLRDEEVWDALTDNYIPSLGEDWRDPSVEALNGNVSDAEVIEEIEEMMQNSPDPEEEEEVPEEEEEEEEEEDEGGTPLQADSALFQEMQALTQTFNNNWSYEGLRRMAGAELAGLLARVEGAIRDYSEELVQQLARRDELEFEKEVKNSFITVLMEVQNKQKEQRELMKKRRKEKGLSLQSGGRIEKGGQMPLKRFSMEGISNILQTGIRQTFGNSGTDKQYLNTVIPYEKKGSPPSVEDLQMLTNSEWPLPWPAGPSRALGPAPRAIPKLAAFPGDRPVTDQSGTSPGQWRGGEGGGAQGGVGFSSRPSALCSGEGQRWAPGHSGGSAISLENSTAETDLSGHHGQSRGCRWVGGPAVGAGVGHVKAARIESRGQAATRGAGWMGAETNARPRTADPHPLDSNRLFVFQHTTFPAPSF
uniref:Fasciculation and elongation protein zeta 1 n=1 Tax=Ornithorhynchus anatinus TaxID=9258 RepID=A0A6I8N632_ORNAN